MSKDTLNKSLMDLFDDERFVKHWWYLKLPGLGKMSANEVWERDPQEVIDYVGRYSE